MKRKVIKQGHNTLTLTLPKKWVSNFEVKAGDELELLEQHNNLLITTHKKDEHKRKVIDISGLNTIGIWRVVSAAYRAGYDEVKINYPEKQSDYKTLMSSFTYDTLDYLWGKDKSINPTLTPVEVIQALVNRLIGVAIIDQHSDHCIIKELLETSDKEFDNALRRIFLLVLSMADDVVEACSTNKKDDLTQIHMIDTNLDRFEDFCFRVLNKKGYHEFKKTPVMHTLVFLLELIGDEYKKIALHLLENKSKATELLKKEVAIQRDQLRRMYTLFYTYKKELITEIYEKDKEGDAFVRKNFESFPGIEKEIVHHLKKVGIYVLSLAELKIDLES